MFRTAGTSGRSFGDRVRNGDVLVLLNGDRRLYLEHTPLHRNSTNSSSINSSSHRHHTVAGASHGGQKHTAAAMVAAAASALSGDDGAEHVSGECYSVGGREDRSDLHRVTWTVRMYARLVAVGAMLLASAVLCDGFLFVRLS